MSELLPAVLKQIGDVYQERPDLILEAWPAVIGPQLALMTRALSFKEGVLTVIVNNSTLHSLLTVKEKQRILAAFKAKFPRVSFNNILFRIG